MGGTRPAGESCLFWQVPGTAAALILRGGDNVAGKVCTRSAVSLRGGVSDESCLDCDEPAVWELELYRYRPRASADGRGATPKSVLCEECLTDRTVPDELAH